jgi:DNA-directed RNA polymerase subunit alpha
VAAHEEAYLFTPSLPKIETSEQNDSYGRFVAEPLDKGFGTTLGNSLRRVLLRYLPGAAVTNVRIEGIQHEFTAIPGVKEDVLDFLLNVKSLKIRALSGQAGKLYLEKEGRGEIHASDIAPSVDFEIVNSDLYLATIDAADGRFIVEMDVELGTGYQPAGSSANLPVGTIPVDAIFTPVRKVNFTTDPVHMGRETSLERLTLEVWTDGTIAPSRAVSRGASILADQLRPFVDYGRSTQLDEERQAIRAAIPDDLFNMPVEKLDLSVRAMNCLRRSGINTVGELVSLGEKELLSLRNFGQKSRQEVEEKLQTLGLTFTQGALPPGEEEEEEPEVETKKTRRKAEEEQEEEE